MLQGDPPNGGSALPAGGLPGQGSVGELNRRGPSGVLGLLTVDDLVRCYVLSYVISAGLMIRPRFLNSSRDSLTAVEWPHWAVVQSR